MTTLIALLVAALVVYLVYRHLNKVTDESLPLKEEAPVVPPAEPAVVHERPAVELAEEPKKERKKRASSAKGGKKAAKN